MTRSVQPVGRGRSQAGWAWLGQAVLAALVSASLVTGCSQAPTRIHGSATTSTATSGVDASSTNAAPNQAPTREQAARAVLASRGRAVLTKDRAGFLATVDSSLKPVAEQQQTLFDNMAEVPFSQFGYELAGPGPMLSAAQQARLGPDAWVAKVVVKYRITNADTADVRHEQYLTLSRRGSTWFVAGSQDGPATGIQRDLWDLGPVHLERGTRSLLLGTSDVSPSLVRRVDRAAGRVDSVWGTRWPRRVVVLVPKNQTELAELLGRSNESGLDQIAAVTTGEVGLPMGQAADRVIINPAQFDQLSAEAAQFVITHEVTHVATRASGSGEVPTWFTEGFADYVASTTAGYSLHRTAPDVLARVAQTGQAPTLPTDADFDAGRNNDIASSYSAAFLAVSYLDRTWGRDAVLELYRAQLGDLGPDGQASTPVPLATAMPQVIGRTLPEFETGFHQFVVAIAKDPTQ